MFGMFDLISFNYTESVRKPKSFRTTDGMHGHITFDGTQVGFESGLEKLFALMMAIDPQVTSIQHQPMTFRYTVTGVERPLRYTPDYRVIRDTNRAWVWGDSVRAIATDSLFEVKPQAVLEKLPLQTLSAQRALFSEIQKDGKFDFQIFTNHSIPKFMAENILRVGNSKPIQTAVEVGLECVDRVRDGSTVSLEKLADDLTARGVTATPTILALMKARLISGWYHRPDFLQGQAHVNRG